MWGPTFADVLDAALDPPVEPVRTRSVAPDFTYRPANPFLFVRLPAFAGPRVVFTPASAAKRTAPVVAAAPDQAEVRRPVRTLTASQAAALSVLTGLGARLSSSFTAHELRREYRLLAGRIHPDRHHGAAASVREQLSRQFADVSDSYRRLLVLVDPRH